MCKQKYNIDTYVKKQGLEIMINRCNSRFYGKARNCIRFSLKAIAKFERAPICMLPHMPYYNIKLRQLN